MHVVKKTGVREKFDVKKIHKSAYRACMSAQLGEETARRISKEVASEIKSLVKGRKEIKSDVIFNRVKRILEKHDKECAFMYETYRYVS